MLNKLYKLGVPETDRDDLVAVLGTGIPKVTFTGNTFADELRINLAVPVTPAGKVSRMGVLGGDNARLPERAPARRRRRRHRGAGGRRLPQGQEGARSATASTRNDVANLGHFPYVAAPHEGYDNSKATK